MIMDLVEIDQQIDVLRELIKYLPYITSQEERFYVLLMDLIKNLQIIVKEHEKRIGSGE